MKSFWKNLHPLFNRLENEDNRTTNGAILHSIDKGLSEVEQKVMLDRPLESLATAKGAYLNYYGDWWGLPRDKNEDDDHYRDRLIKYLTLPRSSKQAIINAIKYYLKDKDAYVDIYEPWRNIFILDQSKLDGADHLQGSYYRYCVIDVSLGVPITDDIMKVINAFKAAGIEVYTNYNPLMNKDNKITYLGTQDALYEDAIGLEMGSNYDPQTIKLGLDDYNYKEGQLSTLNPFILDESKLNSADVLVSPMGRNQNADNLLLGTSANEQSRQVGFKQDVDAKPSIRYSFRGKINPDIRAKVYLNFLNDAGMILQSNASPEIKHNGRWSSIKMKGFTPVDLSAVAPAKTATVQVAIDNRSSITDNQVKKSQASFHNDGTEGFPVSFDLGSDLGTKQITTMVQFTVKNLKNKGYLAIVDGQDTDNWEQLVPISPTAKPPETSDNTPFILDQSKLDGSDVLIKPKLKTAPPAPITKDGTYTYTLTTNKHALKKNATANRIFVKTNLDADIDLKVKLAVYSAEEMDMTYSVYKDEDGYYNGYKIKEFKLASGDTPNLHWTPASSEVDVPSPYYVDIINNTNVTHSEEELRHTKRYYPQGAKLHFAKLKNRNIALKTGVPIAKQNVDKIDNLYELSIPTVAGKTYTVLMNYASDDVDKKKRIVITLENKDEVVLDSELYTNGDVKTYHGVFTAKSSGKFLNLKIKNGTAADLYILNFKLGVD